MSRAVVLPICYHSETAVQQFNVSTFRCTQVVGFVLKAGQEVLWFFQCVVIPDQTCSMELTAAELDCAG